MPPDTTAYQGQLRTMEDELSAMIAIADEQRDHLLAALLCDVHACVVRRYAELVTE